MVTPIVIADHYPDSLPVEIVIGATGKNAPYTVGDLRALLRAVAPAGEGTEDQKRGDPPDGDLCTAVRRYLSYIADVRSGRVKYLDRGVVLNYAQDLERHL